MKYLISFSLLGLILCNSCSTSNKVNLKQEQYAINKDKYGTTTKNGQINTGQIVSHKLVTKNGKITEHEDLYFSLSVQDYFIKFCESDVTLKDIKPFINDGDDILDLISSIKSVTLEIEIKDAEWDNCNEPGYVQSRTGPYVIIKRILN